MEYRGQHSMKDLRASGALGWAHATESVGQYLQGIIPSVCRARIKGLHRHTSSEDKTDPKKVVTTSFYDRRNLHVATCHAHGDGTWKLFFSSHGHDELQKLGLSAPDEGRPEPKVTVKESVTSCGHITHHGEMITKPRGCLATVAINNDEAHRLSAQDSGTALRQPAANQKPQAKMQRDPQIIPANTNHEPPNQSSPTRKNPSVNHILKTPNKEPLPFARDAKTHLLDTEQLQLASDLAKPDLKGKEQRALFQRLKSMPPDYQEQILERSKVIKSRASTEAGTETDDNVNMGL
ncbi:Uu.00g100850.m01.CDS01 [Anthostomella pinea]|uniref:Uu.00g100850.m01.CDS01 n=1 Tax=Anthostomella pinea TaxID=933095 RepID=A0AAI8VE25_9PEZI|nr:Uu.00g100850.m01.CDS01 [Anthostomella pinea]